MRFKIERICDSEGLSIIPLEPARFDMEKCARVLDTHKCLVENLDVMIIAIIEGVEITLYRNGRLMMHPMRDEKKARVLAERFYSLIDGCREA